MGIQYVPQLGPMIKGRDICLREDKPPQEKRDSKKHLGLAAKVGKTVVQKGAGGGGRKRTSPRKISEQIHRSQTNQDYSPRMKN